MALYIGLSLFAVLMAMPSDLMSSMVESPATLLFLTSLGLLVAHWFAFQLSAQLTHRGRVAREHVDLLAAQVVGGLAVTAVVFVPVLVLGEAGVTVAMVALLTFIALVGYGAARMIPLTRVRAGLYVAAVIGVALGVLGFRSLVGH